jgi:hypothetical protein
LSLFRPLRGVLYSPFNKLRQSGSLEDGTVEHILPSFDLAFDFLSTRGGSFLDQIDPFQYAGRI